MRILVIGAGAVGGYFGGRLLEAGRDVTFLVRPGRAAQLARDGLVIRSPLGDAALPAPPHLGAAELTAASAAAPFDAVLLSCKSYDLDSAIAAFAPAVGPDTAVLPLLNGMRHLDALEARFGPDRVLAGQCAISATLDPSGAVQHLGKMCAIGFGERDGTRSARAEALLAAMQGARFDSRISGAAVLEMWEKWVFLATLAGITCLMRASVGAIATAGGAELTLRLLEECRGIAAAAGQTPRGNFLDRTRATLTDPASGFTASMLRDLQRGGATEGDHVLGDLLRRAPDGLDTPLLRAATVQLAAYEAARAR